MDEIADGLCKIVALMLEEGLKEDSMWGLI